MWLPCDSLQIGRKSVCVLAKIVNRCAFESVSASALLSSKCGYVSLCVGNNCRCIVEAEKLALYVLPQLYRPSPSNQSSVVNCQIPHIYNILCPRRMTISLIHRPCTKVIKSSETLVQFIKCHSTEHNNQLYLEK